MDYSLYEDNGYTLSLEIALLGIDVHSNCYSRLWWNYKCYDAITDTARNVFCRAPGKNLIRFCIFSYNYANQTQSISIHACCRAVLWK